MIEMMEKNTFKAIKMSVLMRFGLVLTMPAVLLSCLSDEEVLTGYGDAYVVVEIAGQDTLKGLGLHAFSFSEFARVIVTPPAGSDTTYTLAPYLGYKQEFFLEQPLAEFSKTLPLAGTYVFNAQFTDGQSLLFSNDLTTDYILPPEITLCVYDVSGQRVDVVWKEVAKASSYNVKLIGKEEKILFVSDELSGRGNDFSFTRNTPRWQTTDYPASGDSVVIEVSAYLKEKNSSQGFLQSVSRARKKFVWGI